MGRIRFLSTLGFNRIRCKRSVELQLGPSKCEGLPYVSTEEGYQYACAYTNDAAREICMEPGYESYTSEVYKSDQRDTYYSFVETEFFYLRYLSKKYKSCTERVSCRHRCSYHNLLNGNY